jgi:hypothetical protein
VYADPNVVTDKIDGGGQQLMMKTTFGNIYIRKTK